MTFQQATDLLNQATSSINNFDYKTEKPTEEQLKTALNSLSHEISSAIIDFWDTNRISIWIFDTEEEATKCAKKFSFHYGIFGEFYVLGNGVYVNLKNKECKDLVLTLAKGYHLATIK